MTKTRVLRANVALSIMHSIDNVLGSMTRNVTEEQSLRRNCGSLRAQLESLLCRPEPYISIYET